MDKGKILRMREKGSYGYENTGAVIEAIYELDKTMKSFKRDLQEISKQQKYLWQSIEDAKGEEDE